MLPSGMIPPWRSRRPAQPLEFLQELVREGRFILTQYAASGAMRFNLTREDVGECVCALRGEDFVKCMAAHGDSAEERWQDAYILPSETPEGIHIDYYMKLQLEGKPGNEVLKIVSFKQSRDPS